MATSRYLHCLAAAVLLGAATTAAADTVTCQRRLVKESARHVQTRAKVLQKCEERVVRGKIPGPCPDAATQAKIAKLESDFALAIGETCGGNDRTCGGSVIFEDTPAALGWPAACPGFGGACSFPINHCGDIVECLRCVGERAVNHAIALYYRSLVLPSATPDLAKCQKQIGNPAVRFLVAKSKALRNCWDRRIATGAGSCPDAATASRIANARAIADGVICKRCGGTDHQCGGGDDFTPAEIGFAASCPDVAGPAGDCGASGTTDGLGDLAVCTACITDFDVDCIDALQVPGLAAYPADCVSAPPP